MAWPYDAKDVTYAANSEVPSTNLNAIQERIVDLYEDYTIVQVEAESEHDGVGHPYWVIDPANPEEGYGKNVGSGASIGSGDLYFFIKARVGFVLKEARIKYYNGHATNASTLQFNIYKPDLNFDISANGPSLGAALSTSAQYGNLKETWATVAVTGLTITVAAGETIVLVHSGMMSHATDGSSDRVAGVQLTVQPLTAS